MPKYIVTKQTTTTSVYVVNAEDTGDALDVVNLAMATEHKPANYTARAQMLQKRETVPHTHTFVEYLGDKE